MIWWVIAALVTAVVGGRLSPYEKPNLEKQLRHLPPVTSIRTTYGDLYDCIDFYKQPAFDHPLLKNHTFYFEMKPSSHGKGGERISKVGSRSKTKRVKTLWANGRGCPYGTVPIKRTAKEDPTGKILHFENQNSNISISSARYPGLHYALLEPKYDPLKMYTGVGAKMTTWKLSVTANQYSSAQIRVQKGDEYIQTGWRVDLTLNGDTMTRGFIYTHAGQSQCYNTECPGFVIVRPDQPLDAVLEPLSEPGGQLYEQKFSIWQDPLTGNWWLARGDEDGRIGFWPKSLFKSLKGMASYVNWGGEVYGPPEKPSPQMGSGSSFRGDPKYDACMVDVTYRNETNDVVMVAKTQESADARDYYDIKDFGLHYWVGTNVFAYGGPGGIIGN
ncbi:Neprosin [Dillenia turbinata]|uniref:Neprosin n=1 Tax=Dillenia turbinata TaxID=194707 RepID=A0AAN8W2S7_9MAGN